jgi:hypothetical protein
MNECKKEKRDNLLTFYKKRVEPERELHWGDYGRSIKLVPKQVIQE